ncbi:MFS transporter [Halobacterium litoreum]|uniref:MFS transporter n=1 Tax=Halobacterium litoreum TaxID=2039234 RepID=A0ABD5NGY7_9EURY|nr:MFS transporter [Halobacterium litoreum]UHH12738.1 MFS transporter [Halobacterium litoreum]
MAASRHVVWRYYAYLATTAYGFYLPVGLLYLQSEYGWAVVGLTQGVFSFALLLAEIPTGYLGDRVGRRASLAVGNAISAGALAVFVFLDSPTEYVLLYAVWAFGWAFRSGTEQAWLYELLAAEDEDDEYARLSGRGNTVRLLTSAVTAVLAGVLVTYGWGVPLFANAALSAVGIPLVLALPAVGDAETDGDDAPDPADAFSVREALDTLRLQVARPEVRWLVAYVGVFHVLFAVTRPYESPIAEQVGVPVAALGVLFAAFKVVSAGASASAGWIRDAVGTRRALALLTPVYGLAYAAVAFVPVLVVPVFFLNRSVQRVVGPLRDQYLNDRLADVGRATVLSGASMALSLASGTANLFSGQLVAALGPFRFLASAGVLLAGAGGLLWLAVSPVREEGAATPGANAPAADAD